MFLLVAFIVVASCFDYVTSLCLVAPDMNGYVAIPTSWTTIPDFAFSQCSELKTVDIPASIKSIGQSAFANCGNLESIGIPDSITSIGDFAFSKSGITTATLGQGVKRIPSSAFSSCGKLVSVTMGDSVERIGIMAFESCVKLATVHVPDTVTSIDDSAFLKCAHLTSIVLPDTVERIGDSAFSRSGLTSITVPPLVKTLGKSVFKECAFLLSVTLSEGLETIGDKAFSASAKLASITIPDSVKSIGIKSFSHCIALETIEFGNGLTTIGNHAFDCCSGIKAIELSDTITYIGAFAFQNCNNVLTIRLGTELGDTRSEGMVIDTGAFQYTNGASKVVTVTLGATVRIIGDQAFKNNGAMQTLTFSDDIMLESIGLQAFYQCTSLTSLALPNGLQSIGKYACYQCTKLATVSIPESVATISEYSFNQCTKLSSLTLSEGLQTIEEYAFYKCTSLTTVDIPMSVTSIKNKAFASCSKLSLANIPNTQADIHLRAFDECYALTNACPYKDDFDSSGHFNIPSTWTTIRAFSMAGCWSDLITISIPGSVTTIQYGAFYKAGNLKSVDIPAGVTGIADRAFYECFALTSSTVNIPYQVSNIDWNAFKRCEGLLTCGVKDDIDSSGTFTVPSSWTSIPPYTFYMCDNLKQVTLSAANLDSVQRGAFYGAKSLTSISIPSTVKGIGDQAFYMNYALTSVNIPTGVMYLGPRSFQECSALTSLTIPDTVTYIGKYAFENCKKVRTIVLGNSVETIGIGAFQNCFALESISFPDTLQTIEDYAFNMCEAMTSIMAWGSALKSIGAKAFYACSSLNFVAPIPSSVTSIGYSVFYKNEQLISIDMSAASITHLDTASFYGCIDLQRILLPKSLISFGDLVFYNTNLLQVDIPHKVTRLPPGLFALCSSLGMVTMGSEVREIGISSLSSIGTKDSCGTSNYSVNPVGNENINGKVGVFSGCTYLQSVVIGTNTSNLNTIGCHTFSNCPRLESVSIKPSNTTLYIDENAFENTCALSTLYIGARQVQFRETTFGKESLEIKVDVGGGSSAQTETCYAPLNELFFSRNTTNVKGYSLPSSYCQDGQCACSIGYGNALDTTSPYFLCEKCPNGKVTKPGLAECGLCEPGYFAKEGVCEACGTGKFSETSGGWNESVCRNCTSTQYGPILGSTGCLDCPPGASCPDEGMELYTECPKGHFTKSKKQEKCEPCPTGTYQNKTGQAVCEPCPAGKYLQETGATALSQCVPCEVGYHASRDGTTTCSACGIGTYTAITGGSVCQDCAPGYSTTITGASECVQVFKVCSPGEERGQNGNCIGCEPGFYSPGGFDCLPCDPGTYSAVVNATSCEDCPSGRYGKQFDSLRRFSVNASCESCEPGKYMTTTGALECLECTPGSFCGSKGMTASTPCAPGTYSVEKRQLACTPCPTGQYQTLEGEARCSLCVSGKFNSNTGKDSPDACLDCPPGTYSTQNGTTECSQCAEGQFQSERGKKECLQCKVEFNDRFLTNNPSFTGCVLDNSLLNTDTVVDAMFSKGVALTMAFIIAAVFVGLATVVQLKREKELGLGQLTRFQTFLKSFLPGFSFGSEVLLVTAMSYTHPGTAAAVLFFRSFHLFGGVLLAAITWGGNVESCGRIANSLIGEGCDELSKDMDFNFARTSVPIMAGVTLLSLTDVSMLVFLPWRSKRFVTVSQGFPSYPVMKFILTLKSIQMTASVICQISFLATTSNAKDDPASGPQAKAMFGLNIATSILAIIAGLIMLFLKGQLFGGHDEDVGAELQEGGNKVDSTSVTRPPKDISDMGGDHGVDSLRQDDADAAKISRYTENPLHNKSSSEPAPSPPCRQSMVGDDTISYTL